MENQIGILKKDITPDEMLKINQMFNIYLKDKENEFEISFWNISYSDYIRILKHYIEKIDQDKITDTYYSLDVSIALENGNTYRISFYDDNDIDNFINKYSNVISKDIIKYLINLEPADKIEIMFKDRGSAERLTIDQFNFHVKNTKEVMLKKNDKKIKITGNEKVTYRYKERTSFNLGNVRLDITNVKQSFKLDNLGARPPRYEIELEATDRKMKLDEIMIKVVEVLSVIQDADIPISKNEKKYVLDQYHNLLGIRATTHLDSRNVISIESQHIVKFIPNKYAITDKADGDRYFLFVLPDGVYFLSINLNVIKTNISIKENKYHYLILDGELVINDHGKMFLAFDIVYGYKTDYRTTHKYMLVDRINILNNTIKECFDGLVNFENYIDKHEDLDLNKIDQFYGSELKKYWKIFREKLKESKKLFITRKLYFVPYGIDCSEVFMYANMIWKLYKYSELPPYKLDGIIYTPINAPYLIQASHSGYDKIPLEYKWKPPQENSIDFYIKFVKDVNGDEAIFYDSSVKHGSGKRYKVCSLMVGVTEGHHEKPIPFKINEIDQTANIYLGDDDDEARDRNGEIIEDGTVVEFVFDTSRVGVDDAYKWIAVRTRYDKTESVLKYKKRYGNNSNIAERIWRSIINPVSEENIAGLANPETYQKEMKRLKNVIEKYNQQSTVYYEKKTSDASIIRAYHNWIKTSMINTYAKNAERVLDIGCGRGGDLLKFIHAGIGEYVGFDVDNNGLYVINDSAFDRYTHFKNTLKNVPPMHFINADARGLLNVKAQDTILPSMSKENKNLMETYLSGKKKYNVLNCQFSLHYYLSDKLSWSNFLKNVDNHIADNGYLLITCFDGKLLRDKLQDKSKISISYTDHTGNKVDFFEIVKIYKESELNPIGLGIDVYNSIISNPGTYIREYLVMPDFLEKSFAENCGLELIETDSFFNLFNLYKNYFINKEITNFIELDISKKQYKNIKDLYQILDPTQRDEFPGDKIEATIANFKMSILNRYYVFKKTRKYDLSEPARIVGINHRINIGKVLTPYFSQNSLIVDPTKKTKNINKIYHAIRKTFPDTKPSVYLIKHIIPNDEVNGFTYRRDKFNFFKLKEGTDKILLVYKSPEKIFYPIYYKVAELNKYLLDSPHMIKDLDMLVSITNKFFKK